MWSAHRIPQLHFQLFLTGTLLLYSSNYSVYNDYDDDDDDDNNNNNNNNNNVYEELPNEVFGSVCT
jgi:hypothetical protein